MPGTAGDRGPRRAWTDAVWYFGSGGLTAEVEKASATNLKLSGSTTAGAGLVRSGQGEGREFLRQATEVKNVWIPTGNRAVFTQMPYEKINARATPVGASVNSIETHPLYPTSDKMAWR